MVLNCRLISAASIAFDSQNCAGFSAAPMRKSFLKTSFNAGWAEEFIVKKIPSTNIQAPEKFQTSGERGRPGCSRRRRADGFRRAKDKPKNEVLGRAMCPARGQALHAGRLRSPIPAAWLKQFVINVCFRRPRISFSARRVRPPFQ